MRSNNIWRWIRWFGAFIFSVLSIGPNLLSYFNVKPQDLFLPPQLFLNLTRVRVTVPLPLLVAILILLLPFLWKSITKLQEQRKFFEKIYKMDGIKIRVYTHKRNIAARYQDEIFFKIACAIHGNELRAGINSGPFDPYKSYSCPIDNCELDIRVDKLESLKEFAKSKFLQEL